MPFFKIIVIFFVLFNGQAQAGPHTVFCVGPAKTVATSIYQANVPEQLVKTVYPFLNKSESWHEEGGKAGQESWIVGFSVTSDDFDMALEGKGEVLLKIAVVNSQCKILTAAWKE